MSEGSSPSPGTNDLTIKNQTKMKQFMNKYFSIAFLFVVAASFVACNYNKEDVIELESEAPTQDSLVFVGPDSNVTLPFEIDSIKTVNQLLDSLAAVEVQ